ncbi:enoyl-CoA hydratase [Phocoenobacter skyensis]|uniref:Enoyl-CoA hydratase n=1 Tax=Phocoenobacter skyensis TaxID=97481 RepID=A0ABT9JNC2_9PAST|nr:enoyl-CoA hydratase [Pasteurella skyensis]MDP8080322.1 enoyl-CoA hydratase [Pasteurella skyensis]MDP8086295.1 enoyl-CoA hydratase [Pasteurella skyensis]
MAINIYLAMYKGKGNWIDKIVRLFTWGKYSHCELAVEKKRFTNGHHYEHEIVYECYSSSPRDGGVRCKEINLKNGNWDLFLLKGVNERRIKAIFNETKGMKYDLLGAIGVVIPFIKQKKNKYFCSEWCARVLKIKGDDTLSPTDLVEVIERYRY